MSKRDNSGYFQKLRLRRKFLDKLKLDRAITVLDCCAGADQKIWNTLRSEYNIQYSGCDKKKVGNGVIKCDSVRWLKSGHTDYDVIDIDTYGEPWSHFMALVENFSHRKSIIFLTYGAITTLGGSISHLMKTQAGIPKEWNIPASDDVRGYCVSCCLTSGYKSGIIVSNILRCHNDRGNVNYYGLEMEREK